MLDDITFLMQCDVMETREAGDPRREFLGINLPRPVKLQVRKIAAEMETTLSVAANELIRLGLEAYLQGEHLDSDSGQALELAESLKEAQG